MMPIISYLLIILIITSCLGPVRELYPEKEQQRSVSVCIISHGWHVALAFEGKYLQEKLPGHEQFPKGDFLMIGWGDNKYYPSERGGIGLLLRAAFLPTGSVIHLAGFNKNADKYFANSDIIRVQISRNGMEEMTNYLANLFAYDSNGESKIQGRGTLCKCKQRVL